MINAKNAKVEAYFYLIWFLVEAFLDGVYKNMLWMIFEKNNSKINYTICLILTLVTVFELHYRYNKKICLYVYQTY